MVLRVNPVCSIWPVDGTSRKIFTKYLTGTLDADASTEVAHGVTASKILAMSVICYNGDTFVYTVSEFRISTLAQSAFVITYDDTNIFIGDVGSDFQGNIYRIKIDYYL